MNKAVQLSQKQQFLSKTLISMDISSKLEGSTIYNMKKNLLSQSVRVNKISSKKFLKKYHQKENSIPVRYKQNQNCMLLTKRNTTKMSEHLRDLLFYINPIEKKVFNCQQVENLPQSYIAKSSDKGNCSYSLKKRQHHQKKSLQLKTKPSLNMKCFPRFNSQCKNNTNPSKSKRPYYISDIKSQFQTFSGESEDLTIKLAHFLHFLTIFRLFQTVTIPKKPYKLYPLNSNIRPTTLTVIFDMDETLVHCSQCEQNQYENTITLVKQKQRRDFNINNFFKFHKQTRLTTQNDASENDHNNQFVASTSNLQPKLQDFTSDLTDFATQTKTHFRVQIRPESIEMLNRLKRSGKFQIGLFTSSKSQYADKIISLLDPKNQIFDFKLYRNHCFLYRNNKQDMSRQISDKLLVKDLRILSNRSMQKMVLIDNSPSSMLFQPQNGIPIFSYYGQEQGNSNYSPDIQLLKLQSFLQNLHSQMCAQSSPDVRVILSKYFQLTSLCKQSKIKDQVLKLY